MQDIVIVPTYDRPEMLWLCLSRLNSCPDARNVEIRVYVDNHEGQHPAQVVIKNEVEQVLRKFPELTIKVAYRAPHAYPGNSYNVLMAYKEAYDSKAEYVFLVEDDVLVEPGFFKWHRDQHEGFQLGCSIGVKKEPTHGPYASLGVCFPRRVLAILLPHTTWMYFRNMRQYCKQTFPPSKLDCEQDGLIARMLQGQNYSVRWADTPVAQHVGWYGYHRQRSIRPSGALVERYDQVKYVLSNPQVLRKLDRDFKDIAPLISPCN